MSSRVVPHVIPCPHCSVATELVGSVWDAVNDYTVMRFRHPDNNGFVQENRIPCAARRRDQTWRFDRTNRKYEFMEEVIRRGPQKED